MLSSQTSSPSSLDSSATKGHRATKESLLILFVHVCKNWVVPCYYPGTHTGLSRLRAKIEFGQEPKHVIIQKHHLPYLSIGIPSKVTRGQSNHGLCWFTCCAGFGWYLLFFFSTRTLPNQGPSLLWSTVKISYMLQQLTGLQQIWFIRESWLTTNCLVDFASLCRS